MPWSGRATLAWLTIINHTNQSVAFPCLPRGRGERRFLPDRTMETTKIGLAFHRLLRHAPPASAGRQLAANGIHENGNAQLDALRGPDAVPWLKSSTKSWDIPGELPSTDLEHRRRLARTVVLFFFFPPIVVLTGFIGASLIANLPARPTAAEVRNSVLKPLQTGAPILESSTMANPSPEPATSRPGPAIITTAEVAPAPSSSATALSEGAPSIPELMAVPTPGSEQPAVMGAPPTLAKPTTGVTDTPAEAATAAPPPSESGSSPPSPIAPAQAPAPIPNKAGQELERSERGGQFRVTSSVAASSAGLTSITPRQAMFLKRFGGSWSNVDCKKVYTIWTILGDNISFLHSDGIWSMEQIMQVLPNRILTQTISSKIHAIGTQWEYQLVSGGIAVQNLSAGEQPMIEHRCNSLHGRG